MEDLYSGLETQRNNLRRKPEVCSLQTRGSLLFIETVPTLFPDWSVLCKWGIQICTVWLVQIALSCLLRAVLIVQSGSQSIGWKMAPGVPLWVGRNTVQEADSSVCGFSPKCRMGGRPLLAMAGRLWLWVWTQLITRSLFFSRSTSVLGQVWPSSFYRWGNWGWEKQWRLQWVREWIFEPMALCL